MRRAEAAKTVPLHQRDEIVDRSRLDDEAAVHEELAELQRRIKRERALGASVSKPDRDRRLRSVAKRAGAARGERYLQRSGVDEAGKCRRNEKFHGRQ